MKYTDNFKSLRGVLKLVRYSPDFRLGISLVGGLVMNIAYIAENFVSAILYRSIWSATVTVYYSLLVAIRTYLISSRSLEEEVCGDRRRIRRICVRIGAVLLILDLAVAAMMIYTVRNDSFVDYSGIVLLGFLIYTVYSVASSVRGMKRYLRDDKPLSFAARNMTFAAAMMSVFNLQYSVLTSLGVGSHVIRTVNTLGGVSVFLVIILLAAHLIVKNFTVQN